MGERHRPQQRGDVEAVRHLNHGGEMVGQPVGFETARTGEDGQALSLVGPELLNGRIVALVITRFRRSCPPGARRAGQSVLAERYARGEIDVDEYRVRRDVLQESDR